MTAQNVGRDYLVGTVLVLLILAASVVLIRVLNVVEPGATEEAPQRIGQSPAPWPAVAQAAWC